MKNRKFLVWRWWDWAIFLTIGAVVTLISRSGVFEMFGLGIVIGILYDFTIKQIWIRLWPKSYE
jgi:hypothetical protein